MGKGEPDMAGNVPRTLSTHATHKTTRVDYTASRMAKGSHDNVRVDWTKVKLLQ